MKADIHPQYHPSVKVKCACGNVMTVGSTVADLQTELCSACHPFFTGKQKLVDTAGRVDKFKARRAKAVELQKKSSGRKRKTADAPEAEETPEATATAS